ncbi:hypothetical protein N7533_002001 [Penicillium manginii]|jgi:hypothetical protein|uniref:uncharacterized protein n=1 Tax=Penicillium manginii TaxID=203109 RepID=UPI002549B650|nr:uncharacterized protein N7533_002001 [Penicillium manginii]KAJ5763320.1 hypothetical protein N7533_002001 [Penicillium manginii]
MQSEQGENYQPTCVTARLEEMTMEEEQTVQTPPIGPPSGPNFVSCHSPSPVADDTDQTSFELETPSSLPRMFALTTRTQSGFIIF